LPDVAEVEAGALAAMKEDPTLAVKHPGILRSIKSATGIQDVEEGAKNVINVDLLQMFVKQALGMEPDPVVDGEVIDIKQITDKGEGDS